MPEMLQILNEIWIFRSKKHFTSKKEDFIQISLYKNQSIHLSMQDIILNPSHYPNSFFLII